jgi:hypothetical protein
VLFVIVLIVRIRRIACSDGTLAKVRQEECKVGRSKCCWW